MAYRLNYSDYPGTAEGPPDPDRWVGPQGPAGPQGPQGSQGVQGPPGAGVQIASAPPAPAVPGTLFWDSTEGQLYVYYNDGDSTQWVVANNNTMQGVTGGPFLPLSGATPMTGPLTLAGNATAALQAVPLQQLSLVSVLDHGAKGDGTTDDTAAIQAALNAYAGKAIVYVPNTGSPYVVDTLLPPSNTHLIIDGTLMLRAGQVGASGGGVIMLKSVSDVAISGIGTLDGNGANQSVTGFGTFQTLSASRIRLSGLVLQNAYNWNLNVVQSSDVRINGIRVLGGKNSPEFAGCQDCWIFGSTVQGPTADMGFTFYGGCVGCGAVGNTFYGGYNTGCSVLADSAQSAPCTRILIADNIISDNGGPGIAVISSGGAIHTNVMIANNKLVNNCNTWPGNDGSDIQLQNCQDVLVIGNSSLTLRGTAGATSRMSGIRAAGNQISIIGNTIRNVGVGCPTPVGVGIWCGGTNDLFLSGNRIYDDQTTATTGLAIGGSVGARARMIGNHWSGMATHPPINVANVTGDFKFENIASAPLTPDDWARQGAQVGWNALGNGMTNFVNCRGSGSGGFTWHNVGLNDASLAPWLMYLAPGGGLSLSGVPTSSNWQTQGACIGWNYATDGEIDFISSRGTGPGGFAWYTTDSNAGATPVLRMSLFGGSTLIMPALAAGTSFANDAAAATGGIAVGQLYRNGSQVMCRIT